MQSIPHYQFRPKWFFIIFTAVFLPLFISLGFWQLNRAELKRELLQAYETNSDALVLDWDGLSDSNNIDFYPVELQGYYDNNHSILLDNKIYKGQPGYHVLTPFYNEQSDVTILVNRGWIPVGESRQILPDIVPVQNAVTISGVLRYLDQNQFILRQDANYEQGWPLRAQFIDIENLQPRIGYELTDYMIWLGEDQSHGFIREWKVVTLPAQKHVGYAVQWFAMALALLIMFMVVSVRKIK